MPSVQVDGNSIHIAEHDGEWTIGSVPTSLHRQTHRPTQPVQRRCDRHPARGYPVASPWLPLVLLTVAIVLSEVDQVALLVTSSAELSE